MTLILRHRIFSSNHLELLGAELQNPIGRKYLERTFGTVQEHMIDDLLVKSVDEALPRDLVVADEGVKDVFTYLVSVALICGMLFKLIQGYVLFDCNVFTCGNRHSKAF